MRLSVFFILFLYFSSSSASVSGSLSDPSPVNTSVIPASQSALASKSLLLDIAVINNEKAVAVGHYGHIVLSDDGKQWRQANVPVSATLTSIYFLNDKLGWAVGHDATILHSQDGGESWKIQQYLPDLEKPLLDVYFKNTQQGIAVGAYGQVFRTENGGITWETEFHQSFLFPDDIEYLNELKLEDEAAYLDEIAFILPHFNRVFADGEQLYLTGETGLLAQSHDFGHSWQTIDDFYHGSFFSFVKTELGTALIAGLRGHLFRSDGDLSQWHGVETQTTALLNDIVIGSDNRVFVLGSNGVLLMSNNDGKSFINLPQPDGKPLIAGVWYKDKLIAVSDIGIKIIELPKG